MLALVAHTRQTYPNQFRAFEVKLSLVLEEIRPVRSIPVPTQVSRGSGSNFTVYPDWSQVHSQLWTAFLDPQ